MSINHIYERKRSQRLLLKSLQIINATTYSYSNRESPSGQSARAIPRQSGARPKKRKTRLRTINAEQSVIRIIQLGDMQWYRRGITKSHGASLEHGAEGPARSVFGVDLL